MQDMQDIKSGSRGDMRDLASSSEDTMPPRQPGTEDHPRPEVRRRGSFNGEGSVSLFEILQQRAGHLTPSIAAAMQRSREVQARPLPITAGELGGYDPDTVKIQQRNYEEMISRVVLEDERANKPTSRSIRAAVRAGKLPKITKRKRDDQVEGSIHYEVPVESEDDASIAKLSRKKRGKK